MVLYTNMSSVLRHVLLEYDKPDVAHYHVLWCLSWACNVRASDQVDCIRR
jgi:NADH:ubiquinone oxidoreductase subunit E